MLVTATFAGTPHACNRQGWLDAFYFNLFLILANRALERKHNSVCFRRNESGFCMFLSKRERPAGGKKWTWTRPFARPRPSSTSDEGGSAVPNSRLITAVIWISRIPMDITGPLGSTQTTTTATAMRQKTRPPRSRFQDSEVRRWLDNCFNASGRIQAVSLYNMTANRRPSSDMPAWKASTYLHGKQSTYMKTTTIYK